MFREARHEDLAGLLYLYGQLHPHDPVVDDQAATRVFAQILKTAGLTLFVLEDENQIVATTYLNIIPNLTRSAASYAVIENVVVEETLRGRELGKEIMRETVQVAWDAGCYKVMLLTGSRRSSTHAFYRACGFDANDKTGYVAWNFPDATPSKETTTSGG
jgi:N-acetylglutamate synthase-like GNAT family acetyltransferase